MVSSPPAGHYKPTTSLPGGNPRCHADRMSEPASGKNVPGRPAGRGWGRGRIAAVATAVTLVLAAVVAAIVLAMPRATAPVAAPSTTSATPSETPTATPSQAPLPPPPPTLPPLPPGPLNVLVIGSDIRGNAREAAAQQAATGERADHRADMMMLVHVPADRQRVYGISIMRDTWVQIPGYGYSKINASLEVGGPPLVVATVEALLATRIDHYAMIDFEGFKVLTDALGGIDVNVTVPFTASHDTGTTFTAGVNRLGGQAALEFVRERYVFADGDYQRVRNQQAFVRGIIAHMLGTGKVMDPANAVIGAVAPYVTTEPGFDAGAMATLAFGLRTVDPASSVFFTLPTAGTGFSADGQSIVLPDDAGIAQVRDALAVDGLAGYAAAYGL